MKLIKRNLDKALDVAEIIIKTIRTVADEVKKLKPSTRKVK